MERPDKNTHERRPAMQRKLFALLTSLFLLCVAAPGRSSNTVTGKVHLMDYEAQTGIVLGYPNGVPPLGWFRRTANTIFLPGPAQGHYPSRPCLRLAATWNFIVAIPAHNPFIAHLRTQALDNLLTKMSQSECNVNIERDAGDPPANIVTIAPTGS
jgi:hypothetical protein